LSLVRQRQRVRGVKVKLTLQGTEYCQIAQYFNVKVEILTSTCIIVNYLFFYFFLLFFYLTISVVSPKGILGAIAMYRGKNPI
jgi:phage shock protein PspC (stress-responsive transcriptional regulator)